MQSTGALLDTGPVLDVDAGLGDDVVTDQPPRSFPCAPSDPTPVVSTALCLHRNPGSSSDPGRTHQLGAVSTINPKPSWQASGETPQSRLTRPKPAGVVVVIPFDIETDLADARYHRYALRLLSQWLLRSAVTRRP